MNYITFDQVHAITHYSRASINRLMRDKKYMGVDPFPLPVRLGRRILWIEDEVNGWMQRRVAKRVRTPLNEE